MRRLSSFIQEICEIFSSRRLRQDADLFFFHETKCEQRIKHAVGHAEQRSDSVGRGFLPRPVTPPPPYRHTTSSAVRAAAKTDYYDLPCPPSLSCFSLEAVILLSGLFFSFLFFSLNFHEWIESRFMLPKSRRSPSTFQLDKKKSSSRSRQSRCLICAADVNTHRAGMNECCNLRNQ